MEGLDPQAIGLLADVMGGKSVTQAVEDNGRYQQAGLKSASRLPKKMSPDDRAALEAAGVVFGEEEGLFIAVTTPEGWAVRATDHYMWSDLLDEKGRKRGSIFYKPDFWDQDAFFNVCRRFEVGDRPEGGWENRNSTAVEGYVRDSGKEIHVTAPVAVPLIEGSREERLAAYDAREKAEQQVRIAAAAWLEERYPDWRNLNAYWDEPVS